MRHSSIAVTMNVYARLEEEKGRAPQSKLVDGINEKLCVAIMNSADGKEAVKLNESKHVPVV